MVSILLYNRFARSQLSHGKYQFKYEETVIERFFNIFCCAIFLKESYLTCFVTDFIKKYNLPLEGAEIELKQGKGTGAPGVNDL